MPSKLSYTSVNISFVWETPVRVDGSEALWREALLASRQASLHKVFSTKKIICNFLGDGLQTFASPYLTATSCS